MHFTTLITAIAALASTATAAPAHKAVAEILAISVYDITGSSKRTALEIPLGKLTHFDLSITSLQLDAVTVNVPDLTAPDIKKVVCQRYKDQYGVRLGSLEFTKGKNADISTNPVDFGWVLCRVRV